MATIDSKETIDELIKNDGHFPGDPRILKIVEYTNFMGGRCWGVVWPGEDPYRYNRASEYVNNPKTIWEAK